MTSHLDARIWVTYVPTSQKNLTNYQCYYLFERTATEAFTINGFWIAKKNQNVNYFPLQCSNSTQSTQFLFFLVLFSVIYY